jgi:hypothetical protein
LLLPLVLFVLDLVLSHEVRVEVGVRGEDWVLADEALNVVYWDVYLLLGDPRQLAGLVSLHVFIAVPQEHFARNLDCLVQRIVDEMALLCAGTALRTVVHATGHCLVVLGLLD